MSTNKSIILLFIFTVISLTILTSPNAQEIPNNYDPNETYIDTIDTIENLLDSNQAYKKRFDSLSKDGEWVKAKKTDLMRDLENISEEEELDYYDTKTTEMIYVWRPYGVYYGWNPYYNGNWVFTSYGWVWSSYYSWGWGPYNYGRWYNSGYYGWVWFPGVRWAPNWVTWRNCNNYVGWYPTCPRVYWRGSGNRICSNRLFVSDPKNWVFVDKRDFTKKIDHTTIGSTVNNSSLLKESEKVKTAVYSDPSGPKIKYNGPDVNIISKASGEKITPKKINLVKTEDNRYAEAKSDNTTSGNEINYKVSNDSKLNRETRERDRSEKDSKNSTDKKKSANKKTNSTDFKNENRPNIEYKEYHAPPSESSDTKKSAKEKKPKEKVKSKAGDKERSNNKSQSSNKTKRNTKSTGNSR